jgi:hypothetical protein
MLLLDEPIVKTIGSQGQSRCQRTCFQPRSISYYYLPFIISYYYHCGARDSRMILICTREILFMFGGSKKGGLTRILSSLNSSSRSLLLLLLPPHHFFPSFQKRQALPYEMCGSSPSSIKHCVSTFASSNCFFSEAIVGL